MSIRTQAISGLALVAALAFSQPGRAQSFFSYEVSPRQIVGMLEDDGYELRGPILRRGGVYICNVVSASGNPARLIVDARDGHVLERFATRIPRWRDPNDDDAPRYMHPPRDVDGDQRDADHGEGGSHQEALGDLFTPPSRVYGGDAGASQKPETDEAPAPKPKHHAAKKHRDPSLAKATPMSPTSSGDKPAGGATSSADAEQPVAAPDAKKPAQDAAVKPEAAPSAVASPEPVTRAVEPAPEPKRAEVEKSSVAEPKPVSAPKAEPPKKKINDLPVGTLD